MGENQKHHFAVLSPVAAGAKHIIEAAFEHAEDRFHLPPLTECFTGKVSLHLTTVFLAGLVCGESAAFGRDDAMDLIVLASAAVIGLTIISGIGQHGLHFKPTDHPFKKRPERIDVHTGAARGLSCQDQMASAVPDQGQFWKSACM